MICDYKGDAKMVSFPIFLPMLLNKLFGMKAVHVNVITIQYLSLLHYLIYHKPKSNVLLFTYLLTYYLCHFTLFIYWSRPCIFLFVNECASMTPFFRMTLTHLQICINKVFLKLMCTHESLGESCQNVDSDSECLGENLNF